MFGAGLTDFIVTGGLVLIAATLYAECGFVVGFFLPGDSLLFLAGFLAGQGRYNIVVTILVIFLAAILGNITGYHIGRKAGPKVFTKEDGIFFQKEHIVQAEQFFDRHGGKTLILARFVPVMRTFAPFVAGIGNMPFKKFFGYSTIGAIFWATIIPSLGFWADRVIGHKINIDKYILPIVVGVMALSLIGSVLHTLRERSKLHKKRAARAAEQQNLQQQNK